MEVIQRDVVFIWDCHVFFVQGFTWKSRVGRQHFSMLLLWHKYVDVFVTDNVKNPLHKISTQRNKGVNLIYILKWYEEGAIY